MIDATRAEIEGLPDLDAIAVAVTRFGAVSVVERLEAAYEHTMGFLVAWAAECESEGDYGMASAVRSQMVELIHEHSLLVEHVRRRWSS